jgi:hypothetical protein
MTHENPDNNQTPSTAQADAGIVMPDSDDGVSTEETAKPGWRQVFRSALNKAREQQKPTASRKELSKDRSKSMLVLVGAGVVLLLVFFGVFSSPKKRAPLPGESKRGPSLGRKVTPGQEDADTAKAVAPMLSADVRGQTPQGGEVTAEDVGRTARTSYQPALPPATTLTKPSPVKPVPEDYALKNVDFSDPASGQAANSAPNAPTSSEAKPDLKKPSIVFVRSANASPAFIQPAPSDGFNTIMSSLPAGTKLVARLQAPVSSAVETPVVAVVEYSYERDGEIILPAGTKVFGRLSDVNSSGLVGIKFDQVEMPDGTTEKIEASAMSLKYGPLKGNVSGKKTGTKFLVRSLTGLGTVASYLVGPQPSSSEGLISTNALMRERLATNVATAGQEQLNNLTFNQNVVVTVAGNTRFYIVLQKATASNDKNSGGGVRNTNTETSRMTDNRVPSLEELRELMQLRRELNQMVYQPASAQSQAPESQQ